MLNSTWQILFPLFFFIIRSKLRINIDITAAMKCQREYPALFIINGENMSRHACIWWLWLQMLEQIFWTWLRPWSHPTASSTSLWVKHVSKHEVKFNSVFVLFAEALLRFGFSKVYSLCLFRLFLIWLHNRECGKGKLSWHQTGKYWENRKCYTSLVVSENNTLISFSVILNVYLRWYICMHTEKERTCF